jgi:enamine deaminase RidA (YjgF/YER057c/UK114 family)
LRLRFTPCSHENRARRLLGPVDAINVAPVNACPLAGSKTIMHANIQHLNPAGLHKHPAYTQAVVVSGNVRTIYVGGQNAVDASGNLVGKGDIRAQTEKALRNIETALVTAGGGLQHVVKWNVYIVHGQSAQAGFEAFQKVWGQRGNPPVISGIFVAALAQPDFLVEIDAIAVVPEQ